jgi:hypothetical protein
MLSFNDKATDGVALAAIQGVYQIVQDKEARIAALEKNNRELQMRLQNVEALAHALSNRLPSGRRPE